MPIPVVDVLERSYMLGGYFVCCDSAARLPDALRYGLPICTAVEFYATALKNGQIPDVYPSALRNLQLEVPDRSHDPM